MFFLFIFVFASFPPCFGAASVRIFNPLRDSRRSYNYMDALIANMMRGYNKKRPSHSPLKLYTYMFIEQMKDFNEYDMTMELQATLVVNWLDQRLQWEPLDNGNLTKLLFSDYKISRFWMPQVQVKAIMPSKRTVLQPINTELLITQSGHVFAAAKLNTIVTCDTQLQDYPFDRPNCSLYVLTRNFEGENSNFRIVFGNFHSISDQGNFFHGGNVSKIKEVRITNFTYDRFYVTTDGLKVQGTDNPNYIAITKPGAKPVRTLGSFVRFQVAFERNNLLYTSSVIFPLYMGTLLMLLAAVTDQQKPMFLFFILAIFFQYVTTTRISFNLPPNYTVTPFCMKYAALIFIETIILFIYKMIIAYLAQSYKDDPKMLMNLAFVQHYFRYFLGIQFIVYTTILLVF
ncbi:Neuronal acetylcholine receptor subunit alpha-10-like protein [Aphelenchoides bicaudatus]|nr:Neuronal acetylcholine receptor subunit alpha-10-like protein [Aphelenchoides bicaudatus]